MKKIFYLLFIVPLAINSVFIVTVEKQVVPDKSYIESFDIIRPVVEIVGFPFPYYAVINCQHNSGTNLTSSINLFLDILIYLAIITVLFHFFVRYIPAPKRRGLIVWYIVGSLTWIETLLLLFLVFYTWNAFHIQGMYENYKTLSWAIRFFWLSGLD